MDAYDSEAFDGMRPLCAGFAARDPILLMKWRTKDVPVDYYARKWGKPVIGGSGQSSDYLTSQWVAEEARLSYRTICRKLDQAGIPPFKCETVQRARAAVEGHLKGKSLVKASNLAGLPVWQARIVLGLVKEYLDSSIDIPTMAME